MFFFYFYFLIYEQNFSRALQQRKTIRVMCCKVLAIVPFADMQWRKKNKKILGPSGKRFILFFSQSPPAPCQLFMVPVWFQMLFSLTPSQASHSVQTCLHLIFVFLCIVDVLLKGPISNKSLFLFCPLIFCVFMNSGLSHGNS